MKNNDNQPGSRAMIDFRCFESDCEGVVKFRLADVTARSFQVVCPVCHKAYSFDPALRAKFEKMFSLLQSIRDAEEILGSSNVSINVASGEEIRIPYALLLTRLNTLLTLEAGGRKVDFHLRVEPSSAETFR